MEEKRGEQQNQTRQVVGFFTRHKAQQIELNAGTSKQSLSIFNLILDDMLLFLAHAYDINMGKDNNKTLHN